MFPLIVVFLLGPLVWKARASYLKLQSVSRIEAL